MKTTILFCFSILLLSQLYGQGWVRQNPFAKLARLNDVSFDGPFGLTVGSEGVVFTTNDGGNNWVYKKTPDADEDLRTAFVMPGTNGQTLLAGGDSLLLLSFDGGVTWRITYDDLQGIYKIQLMPTGEWMVLGSTYAIRSSDQGGFWRPFNNPALGATAGHFISVNDGWVAAGSFNNSQVWITNDAGFHWTLRDSVRFSSITDLDMINDNIGYLITGSQIYKTIDGGWHWESQNANPTNNITDMYIASPSDIWTCLDNGNVFYSLTSGGSWTERSPDLISNSNTKGIYADLQGHVYLSGNYVTMLYSDDFGQTWRDQIPGNKAILFQPHFFNEFIGIVGGSGGTLMRTINGGDLWQTIQFPRDDHFFAAEMIDAQTMVIGSSRGRVYLSENLGMHWDTIGTGLGQITDVHAFSHDVIIITNENGIIYKTTNQGAQWNKVFDNDGTPLFAIDFNGSQNGWACGYEGKIVMTTNGGDSWNPQTAPGKGKFADITFTTAQEGWAVSNSFTDTLWFTQDAGQTWQTSHLPYASYWRGVSFTNPDTGWIAGGVSGVGDVLRTNDRGVTWTQNHTSPEIFNGIYAVPDKETVWAVGNGGNIMKYSPCHTEPRLENLIGVESPCKGDTVQYSVSAQDVDYFLWLFPPGWMVLGSSNNDTVTVIAGENSDSIQVKAANACGNLSDVLSMLTTPVDIPEIIIGESKGNVLFTNLTSLEYQWILNGVPIPGATDPFYTAVENGTYQLIVTIPGTGCSGLSNALDVMIVGLQDSPVDKLFVYPSPATDLLYVSTISGKDELQGRPFFLFSSDGKIVLKETFNDGKINISGIQTGIYVLMIKAKKETLITKVVVE